MKLTSQIRQQYDQFARIPDRLPQRYHAAHRRFTGAFKTGFGVLLADAMVVAPVGAAAGLASAEVESEILNTATVASVGGLALMAVGIYGRVYLQGRGR